MAYIMQNLVKSKN